MSLLVASATRRQPVSTWWPAAVAVAQRRRVALYPVLTLTLPDGGGTKRYGLEDVPSRLLGRHEALVASFGTAAYGVTLRTGELGTPSMRIRLLDKDRQIAAIEHAYRSRLRQTQAQVRALSPDLDDGAAPVIFTGIVWSLGLVQPGVYELELRVDDSALRFAEFPQETLQRVHYTDIPQDAVGLPMPIIYGVFDSLGSVENGLVPGIRVGTGLYHVGIGRLNDFLRVFKDGVEQTTGYTINYGISRGGVTVTDVFFTVDPGVNASITFDLEGLEDRGDGTGTVLTNPVRVLQHIAANFWWSRWRTGDWYASSVAPLDLRSAWIVERKMGRRGYRAAAYFGDAKEKPIDAFNRFCKENAIASWWTPEGDIALGMLDPLEERTYLDRPWVRGDVEDRDAFAETPDASGVVRRLSVQYVQVPLDGSYLERLDVMDHTVAERTSEETEASWATAEV